MPPDSFPVIALLGYFKDLLKRFQGEGNQDAAPFRRGLLARPSRSDVIQAFHLILGREPENEAAINAHIDVATIAELRQVFLNSEEFRGKFRSMHPDVLHHPSLNFSRPSLLFIHLQKTGGTSLREILSQRFPHDRRCPVLEDKLHVMSLAELSYYDFFAGHFDVTSIGFIPRDSVATVAMFREPRARLISFYRFLRSHPATDEFAGDWLIPLAHALTAEEFFERPELRKTSVANNHYLCAFGCSFSWFDRHWETVNRETLSSLSIKAQLQIRALTALGITEQFNDSVQLICATLGVSAPQSMKHLHATDQFAAMDARFRRVEAVQNSPRLAAAMEDLVEYDLSLYECAVSEFERRAKSKF